jgi:hypothetical protein
MQELYAWLAVEEFLALEATCRSLFLAGHQSSYYFPGMIQKWCVRVHEDVDVGEAIVL